MMHCPPRAHYRVTRWSILAFAAFSLGSSAITAATEFPRAPPTRTMAQPSGPIKDNQGRIRYIIDLIDDHRDKPAKFDDVKRQIDWHKDKSAALIDDVIKLRGVELIGSTSLVGTSFTTYLTDKQLEQFSKDKRVSLITPDVYLQPSALWNDSGTAPSQITPWGIQAVAAGGGASNGGATV